MIKDMHLSGAVDVAQTSDHDMLRVFLASHSLDEAKSLANDLQSNGFALVSRWIWVDTKFHKGIDAYTDDERRQLALLDEEDVRRADCVVLIAAPVGRTVPGGKHVETGIALGIGLPVYVLGRRENIFHWHPAVTMCPDIPALLQALSHLRGRQIREG